MAASDWSERTRLLITLGVVAVINLGVWGFAYKVRGDWQIEEKKLNGIRAEISSLNAFIAQKPDLEQKRNTLKRESDTKEKKLPNEHHRDKFTVLPPEKTGRFYRWAYEQNLLIGSGVNVLGTRQVPPAHFEARME